MLWCSYPQKIVQHDEPFDVSTVLVVSLVTVSVLVVVSLALGDGFGGARGDFASLPFTTFAVVCALERSMPEPAFNLG